MANEITRKLLCLGFGESVYGSPETDSTQATAPRRRPCSEWLSFRWQIAICHRPSRAFLQRLELMASSRCPNMQLHSARSARKINFHLRLSPRRRIVSLAGREWWIFPCMPFRRHPSMPIDYSAHSPAPSSHAPRRASENRANARSPGWSREPARCSCHRITSSARVPTQKHHPWDRKSRRKLCAFPCSDTDTSALFQFARRT